MSRLQEETSLEAKREPGATGSFSVVAEVRRARLGDAVLSDGEVRWM